MAVEALKNVIAYQEQPETAVRSGSRAENTETEVARKQGSGAAEWKQAVSGQENQEEKTGQKENGQVRKAAEQIGKKLQNCEALFGIHEETNRVTIKIVNKDTKEVLKEIPPEKTLDMLAKAWELAGLMIDEKR